MIIGVPSEVKNNENRIGMTPDSVSKLTKKGHEVFVQESAGANIGFFDQDFISAGAKILGALSIGDGSKIGAGSVVLNSIPAGVTVAGVPAKIIGRTSDDSPSLTMNQKLN